MAWAFLDQARSAPDNRKALIETARMQLTALRDESLAHARLLLGISDRPLTERINELIERYRAVLPLTLDQSPEILEVEGGLSCELRSAAHDMVEEGLLNSFRHAAASHVVVRLAAPQPGLLTVEVRDDGIGFEPQAQTRGLGLSGLGDMLQALGGTWRLDSTPGKGTCLTLTLPLHSPREVEAA